MIRDSNKYAFHLAKAVEYMITDALVAANPYLKMSDAISSPEDYLNLNDSILSIIEYSKDEVRLCVNLLKLLKS
jgi:hypothetical protein